MKITAQQFVGMIKTIGNILKRYGIVPDPRLDGANKRHDVAVEIIGFMETYGVEISDPDNAIKARKNVLDQDKLHEITLKIAIAMSKCGIDYRWGTIEEDRLLSSNFKLNHLRTIIVKIVEGMGYQSPREFCGQAQEWPYYRGWKTLVRLEKMPKKEVDKRLVAFLAVCSDRSQEFGVC